MVPNYHPTWDIYDSSKLSTYQTCARLYFYEYVLGWRREGPAHDLYFGNAWHEAREYQLLNGYDDVEGAFQAILDFYRKEFPEESDFLFTPKDPKAVRVALEKFRNERRSDLQDNEVLFTETSGTVPITETISLHYRLDSILRRKEDGKIFSWDHKSAKNFGRTWSDKFFLAMQTGTYTHCLYCMYPIDTVLGIEFCGTAFKYFKRGGSVNPKGYGVEFLRVPAWKTPDQMNTWLWNTIDLVYDLKRDMERLDECREDDKVLHAFRMNTESCTKYWGCQFHDYCQAWPNPLVNCHEPPLGYRLEWWDPSEMDTTNKMDLEPYGGTNV
jgi:hypothetical protein